MLCKDCFHFHIRQHPIKAGKESKAGYWDLGLAECGKHNLVVDFLDRGKLNRLECVERGDHDA